jgi:sugar phosphate isomerase/epimerase
MLDPDSEKRRANMDYVIERMALAEAVAARCCVNIAGSYHPRIWFGPHPKNLSREFFDATVENCRRVIDAIKPKRSTFSIEMMPWSLPDGPESYLALMKAVDRRQFSVHIDICNVVNSPERFYNHAHLIVRCFRLLGAKTSSCHAKDLDWATEYNIHFREVGPGKGQIDYRTYLREVAPTGAPLMLEHLKTPEEYEEAKNHILSLGKELGLTFA